MKFYSLQQQKYLARHYRLVDIEITRFPFATHARFPSFHVHAIVHLVDGIYQLYNTQQIIIIWCAVVGFRVMLLIEQRWCGNFYLKKRKRKHKPYNPLSWFRHRFTISQCLIALQTFILLLWLDYIVMYVLVWACIGKFLFIPFFHRFVALLLFLPHTPFRLLAAFVSVAHSAMTMNSEENSIFSIPHRMNVMPILSQ